MAWSRESPWRQGHLLDEQAIVSLEIADRDSAVVIISHDCDLANLPDTEPKVELMRGRFLDEADQNYTYTKNARKLHLQLETGGDFPFVEFLATEKIAVEKNLLAGWTPCRDRRLSLQSLGILQRWLAARYRRAAFPDEFENRLRNSKLIESLAKILRSSGDIIRAIYFDVDGGEEVPRSGPADIYVLDIFLLYDGSSDESAAFAVATGIQNRIERAFRGKLFDNDWKFIELRSCSVISDHAMTVAQSEKLKQWRMDYISLREDPPQSLVD